MRRADCAMRREAALETIDRCTFGTLAMCAPDGTPYAVALNLVRDGDRLYYHAATEGLKAELLRQNPKVCALFVDGAAVDEPGLTTYYASAVVRGTAREITDADEKRRALRALRAEHSGGKDFVHRERPRLHRGLVHRNRIGDRQAERAEGVTPVAQKQANGTDSTRKPPRSFCFDIFAVFKYPDAVRPAAPAPPSCVAAEA